MCEKLMREVNTEPGNGRRLILRKLSDLHQIGSGTGQKQARQKGQSETYTQRNEGKTRQAIDCLTDRMHQDFLLILNRKYQEFK